jgi:putative phage-type endonuclease
VTALRQGTPEWLEARRAAVSSTDLPVILGLSPWRSEWDLAEEKLGRSERQESTLPMRVGLALEPLIRDEYERQTGERLRRVRTLVVHPTIEWAVASPDYRVVGRPWLVEAKWTTSSRWNEGLPQDVEAQVQWALGVTTRPRADVAVLVGGRELRIHPVEYDDELFEGLLEIAADFRLRLLRGGPFGHNLESLRRAWPVSSGRTIEADGPMVSAVSTLLEVRGRLKALEEQEDRLKLLVQDRMADAAHMTGPGWRVDWQETKEYAHTDWKLVAEGLLRTLTQDEREALVSLHSKAVRKRPFTVRTEKGTPE